MRHDSRALRASYALAAKLEWALKDLDDAISRQEMCHAPWTDSMYPAMGLGSVGLAWPSGGYPVT